MILDERTEFCDAAALNTGGAGSYLIGDQIDLTLARDIGRGEPIWLVISITTSLDSGGSNTTQFHLASDSTASIATNGSASYHYSSAAFAYTALTAGTIAVAVALPMEGVAYERYLGILHTTATAALTAGAVNAFLTHDVAKWKAYADASN